MKKNNKLPLGRWEKSLLTRRRILRAAGELFVQRGYAGTSMDQIAEAASVAVQTLYFTFHTKSALLEECVGAAILGVDAWDPRAPALAAKKSDPELVRAHAWFQDFEQANSAADALRLFVAEATSILQRVAMLSLVQVEAAASDPMVRATWELAEQRRLDTYQTVAASLSRKRKYKAKLTVKRARDVLLAILSAQTYHQLVVRLGWSTRQYEKWCAELLQSQFYG